METKPPRRLGFLSLRINVGPIGSNSSRSVITSFDGQACDRTDRLVEGRDTFGPATPGETG